MSVGCRKHLYSGVSEILESPFDGHYADRNPKEVFTVLATVK